MGRTKHTDENSEALDLSECLTTEESEVDLSIETDFLADEENFEVSDDSADDVDMTAFDDNTDDETADIFEEGFNDEYIELPEFSNENFGENPFAIPFEARPQYERCGTQHPFCSRIYETMTELAKFGQTLTNDKQRDTVLDLMWMCAMNKYD